MEGSFIFIFKDHINLGMIESVVYSLVLKPSLLCLPINLQVIEPIGVYFELDLKVTFAAI